MSAKTSVQAQASKAKAKPSGLAALSAQQRAAYTKAYTASIAKSQLAAAANRYRASRLAAASRAIKRAKSASSQAAAGKVAQFAISMSARQAVLGKQSSALRARINANLKTATSRYDKLQSTAAYDSKTAAAAIMKTVTSSQAVSHEKAVEAAAAKVQSKSKKTAKSKAKSSAATAAATKAGLAAASKVKSSASSSSTVKGTVHQGSSSVRTVKSSSAKASQSSKKSAVSKVSPVARGAAKGTQNVRILATSDDDAWFGAEHTDDCVAAAIANHMLYVDGIRPTRQQVAELTALLGYAPTIRRGLRVAASMARRGAWPAIPRFAPNVTSEPLPGMIVGYEALTDEGYKPHAALLVGDFTVISWGDEYALDTEVEESWVVRWRSNTSSVAQTP